MNGSAIPNISVEAALLEARERYAAGNPRSRALHDRACASLPGGNTRTILHFAPFPPTIARGEGAYLWDADGHRYVDFLNEHSAALFGHSHPAIRAAVERALDAGIDLGGQSADEAELAASLTGRFPSIDLVRFTNSGTEANLTALNAARGVTGRSRILVFEGGFHGGSLFFGKGGSPVNAPFEFVVGRYNDAEGVADLIDRHAANLAAVLVEPMMGYGGCVSASGEFLRAVREATAAKGVILIFDEVMTSRLAPGGLQEKTGVTPDMTTLGKYLAGGMSFGAFGGRAEIMERFDPRKPDAFPHPGTFNNNALSMSAGVAAAAVYTAEANLEMNRRGDRLRARLNAQAKDAGVRLQFLGEGSMLNAHPLDGALAEPADLDAADPQLRELFFHDMLAQGIWLAPRGMATLSLPMTDADCERFVEATGRFVEQRAPLLR